MMVEGHRLVDVELAGTIAGAELGTAPVVAIVGGITASPYPFGGDDNEAWWPALRGEGLIDLERSTLVCLCWPGHGSTWRGFDEGTLPPLSALGLADLFAAWLEGIGVTTPVTYLGASLGGLVGIALAVRHPERVAKLVTISAGLRPDAWGTATRHLQRELVRDGLKRDDVTTGMQRARQLGMLTYRGRDELDTRFGVLLPELTNPPIAEYLDHHGKRFAARFPLRTFMLLSEAIDRTHFSNPRQDLASVAAEVLIIAVPGDLLFPYALQHELYRELQAAGATASLWKLESEFGHDAFLADQRKLATLIRDTGFLGPVRAPRIAAAGARPLREIRVGMIGCGTVGSGVLELLARQEAALAVRYRVKFRVTKLAVRDADKLRPPLAAKIPRITRPIELVADPEVDVIVEVAGGEDVEPALVAALAAGKPVVTANKALLAKRLAALGALAQRTETPLLCEAAAAAALPIIRHLSHRADEIEALQAIVNGTCNFVITRLEQDELSLERALGEAQALGLTEADPADDIDGHEAAAKLSILAYRAFGAWIPPSALPVRGIRELVPADCIMAETLGFRIRLLAHAARVGQPERSATLDGSAPPIDVIAAAVEPVLLPDWHLLASVEEEYNAVYMKTAASGDLSLFGKGAGALPAATAILGDLIDLAQDNSVQWPAPREVAAAPAPARRHFVRVTAEEHPGLVRRIDSLVRRAGLAVQSRAECPSSGQDGAAATIHLGFVISISDDAAVAAICDQVRALSYVQAVVWYGVLE
jgi:homoserine dehydrogenase